jgi:hypothetical protein
MTNMEVTIQLPAPVRRSSGLFVNVADTLDLTRDGTNRLGLGVNHIPWGCNEVFVGPSELCLPTSPPSPVDPADQVLIGTGYDDKQVVITDYPDVVTHPAFKVLDGLECSSISLPHDTTPVAAIGNRLRWRIQLQMSKMLMAEWASGRASGGPSLASEDEVLSASASMAMAAVRIENFLAGALHNAVGVVVLPVGLLTHAVASGWVNKDTLRTNSGHYVIADAGFTGDPTNPTDSTPGSYIVYGTGVPSYTSNSTALLEVASGASHVDITDNVISEIMEAYAQIAFDPCAVGSTVVTIS